MCFDCTGNQDLLGGLATATAPASGMCTHTICSTSCTAAAASSVAVAEPSI